MPDEVEKLSGKLGIDTTDFKTALGAANRELRVLESSFKAGAAALTDWTKNATGLENRAKSLTRQIDIQAAKVDALEAEHRRLVDANGANSRAAQDAEIKLNKETETLNKMERELGETETALQEMSEGTEATTDSVEEMGEQMDETETKVSNLRGTLTDLGKNVIGAVVTGLAALAAAAVGAAVGIAGMVFNAAEAAAELVDLSAVTGLSTTQLQEMRYVGDQVGTSLDTITSAQARLIRSMDSATQENREWDEALKKSGKHEDEFEKKVGDTALAFNTLRVATVDANGNLRDSQDVFNDIIDALGRVENETERDALAMQIFGKSARELNPLIKAGSDELARLAQEAHDVGAVMDEDAVAGLEAFDDTMASIKAGIQGTLGSLAAEFLPAFQEMGSVIQDLFKSEEFKQGFAVFVEGLREFVGVVTEAIKQLANGDVKGALTTLFGADQADGLLNLFNTVRSFMQDTLLPFLSQHGATLLKVLAGIAAGLAAFSIISTVVGWVSGLIAAVSSLAGIFTAAGGGLAGIVAVLGGPVTIAIGAIIALIALLAAAWNGNWGGIRDTLTQIWEGYIQPAFKALGEWLSVAIPAALQTLSNFWKNTLLPAIQAVWSFLSGSVFPLFQAIGEFIGAVFNVYLRVLSGLWQNVLLPALRTVWSFLDANIFPIFRALGDYISENLQPVLDNLSRFLRNTLVPAFTGISNAIKAVIDWLKEMADRLDNLELPDWLTPGSPTPWEIGLIGINNAMQELNKQLPAMANNLNQVSLAGGSGRPTSVSNTTNQNDQFQFFAPVVLQGSTPANSLGARLKARRY